MAAQSNPWVSTRSTGPTVNFQDEFDASNLGGRSAVVTGGATGIGKGCVEGLAQKGVYVTFCDVNEVEGLAAEKEFTDQGLHVKFVRTDVTSWEQVVTLFKAAVAFSPKETVDIVIPNAGIAGPAIAQWLANTPLNSVTKDPLPPNRKVVDVNYLAVWNTVHAAMFYFKNFSGSAEDTHSKLIVFVSSMAGYTPMPSVIDYNSSKWGVRGIFWSLRNTEKLLGEDKPKFRVNLIAPSWIRTNMTARFQAIVKERGLQVKIGDVSDCVDVVLRMASDESVVGRAAAIVGDRQSFDLNDDSEGYGVGKTMTDPDALRRLGYTGRRPRTPEAAVKEESKPAVDSHSSTRMVPVHEPSQGVSEKQLTERTNVAQEPQAPSEVAPATSVPTTSGSSEVVPPASVPAPTPTTTSLPPVAPEPQTVDRDAEARTPGIAVQ